MTEQIQFDLHPKEAVPAYRSVARSISERILNGALPVGSALPSESALAQSLGINRSTVREAIRALEESGMLRRRPGGIVGGHAVHRTCDGGGSGGADQRG
jgi:GntR family transcriptional repressor for pyruvate dehydrogenase complex